MLKTKQQEVKNLTSDVKLITYNKNHYTIMANDIIKGKQEMTLMEAKIIRLLVTQVVKEDKDLRTYTCRIQELADFLNISSNNIYRDIYNICEKLLKRLVKIGTGNPRQPWKLYQWVNTAEYDGKGNVTFKLSDDISKFVVELNSWYTQYQLANILEFSSFYAIRLYELIKCEEGIARNARNEFTFSIAYLREVLCCEEKYKKNNDFIKKVILIGIREINEKSDIELQMEYKKTGREITGIEFSVWYNVKNNFNRKDELDNESR